MFYQTQHIFNGALLTEISQYFWFLHKALYLYREDFPKPLYFAFCNYTQVGFPLLTTNLSDFILKHEWKLYA